MRCAPFHGGADSHTIYQQRMQEGQVTITHPFVTEPFAYFFADPNDHVIQVYFDPKAK